MALCVVYGHNGTGDLSYARIPVQLLFNLISLLITWHKVSAFRYVDMVKIAR